MDLKSVVPWGRNFQEYREMFSLTEPDLRKKILGCSDGPASFNAELTERSGSIVSVDPLYCFKVSELRSRIKEVYAEIMPQLNANKSDYIWERFTSPEELGKNRMQAMELFLSDYPRGKQAGRYVSASLPKLPFPNNSFDLALCSHYLFLYSAHVNLEEHIVSMKELCRVAGEVRVYPLVSLNGELSSYVGAVMSTLKKSGLTTTCVNVSYRFQKGATQMLIVKADG